MSEKFNVHKVFASFFESPEIETSAMVVSEKLEEGHTCLDIDTYNKTAEEDEKIDIENVKKSKWVNSKPSTKDINSNIRPFILDENNLYLHRYYSYETEIIEQIKQLINNESNSGNFSTKALDEHKDFIKQLFSDHEICDNQTEEENINWQLTAAITSVLSNFSIITGGPGTGKTTTVAKLLAVLFTLKPDLEVALAAPTGKAAARMKESLTSASSNLDKKFTENFNNLNASTLHRLLGYRFGTHYFKNNKDNPLDYDVVIIDESSMIGASMMAKLLNAIKPTSKIIMLGDKDQLASVEAGSIFGDICLTQDNCMNIVTEEHANFINSFITDNKAQLGSNFITKTKLSNTLQQHIIELKKSHRFKSYEGIGQFSSAVISGKISDELFEKPNTSKEYVMECNNSKSNKLSENTNTNKEYVMVCNDYKSDELEKLFSCYRCYINEGDISEALNKLNKVRILCAVHSGKYGVDNYNKLIKEYLKTEGLLEPTDSFYENQPIMITQNDKDQDLFNGDVGIIRKDKETEKYKAYFEGTDNEKFGYRSISTSYLTEFTTVFAMTIHKSQGSEFERVGIVLPDDDEAPLLTRELIYTAITRAKHNATIFTSKNVLMHGVEKQVERASGITKRFLKL